MLASGVLNIYLVVLRILTISPKFPFLIFAASGLNQLECGNTVLDCLSVFLDRSWVRIHRSLAWAKEMSWMGGKRG